MTKFVAVDTNDDKGLKRLVAKHDLVVHTVGPFRGRTTPCEVLKTEIESGCEYVAICDDVAHANHSKMHEKEAVWKDVRELILI